MNDVMGRLAADISDLLAYASFPRDEKDLVAAAEAVSVQLSRLETARALLAGQLEAVDYARRHGDPSVRVWLRQRCRISVGAAHRAVQLGGYLGGSHLGGSGLHGGADRERLLSAMGAGQVTVDQGLVIGNAITDLPREVGPDIRGQAEQTLIGLAATLTPAELAIAGERILELVAPGEAERLEAQRLARRDRDEHRRRQLHIRTDHTGAARLSGRLDPQATAVVRTAIDALARPLPAADGTRDLRSAGQRNADALHELCRQALHETRLPEHGGSRPQIIVTIDYHTLAGHLSDAGFGTAGLGTGGLGSGRLGTGGPGTGGAGGGFEAGGFEAGSFEAGGLDSAGLGAGSLDTGVRLSAQTIRRLACDAQIIPAVLGTGGELLDLGRSQRLITGALRTALIARDRGCTFPGCDRPPRWCQAHHIIDWAQGGATSLDNSTLLCGFHHRTIHNRRWQILRQTDGRLAYTPPPHIDPLQRPRYNTTHLRR